MPGVAKCPRHAIFSQAQEGMSLPSSGCVTPALQRFAGLIQHGLSNCILMSKKGQSSQEKQENTGEQTAWLTSCRVVEVLREPWEEKMHSRCYSMRPLEVSGQVPATGLRLPVALSKQVAPFFSKGRSWHVWPFSWLEGALGTCPVQSSHGLPGSPCVPLPLRGCGTALPFFLLRCSV